jgi:hypothetical protein
MDPLNCPCLDNSLDQQHAASSSEASCMTTDNIQPSLLQIGCNTPAVRELLGDEGAVTEANVMAYLGIVEQRTNELLQVRLAVYCTCFASGVYLHSMPFRASAPQSASLCSSCSFPTLMLLTQLGNSLSILSGY